MGILAPCHTSGLLPPRLPNNQLSWAVLCPPPKIHVKVEALTPVPQNVTVFGDRAFKKAIKLK